MSKFISRPIGEIHEVRKVKTFGDKVKDFFQQVIGVVVVFVIITVAIKIFT